MVDMTPNQIIISPGQACLLLIKKLGNVPEVEYLKEMYLMGTIRPNDDYCLFEYFKIYPDLCADYFISTDYQRINDDPTRRYFETHLCYNSMNDAQSGVNLVGLRQYRDIVKQWVPEIDRNKYSDILSGKTPVDPKSPHASMLAEYADALKRVDTSPAYKNFTPEAKEKLKLTLEVAFWGVHGVSQFNSTLPLSLYGRGIYESGVRGKVLKDQSQQNSVHSSNLGLLKSHMPVPEGDIARSETPSNFLRPVDQSGYDPNAWWVKHNAATLMNPFSNSISGTLLCQFRAMKFLYDLKLLPFTDLTDMLKTFTSVMLYSSGGHTLKEFMHVVGLPEVQEAFKSMPNFNQISAHKLFYETNRANFDKSLDEAIAYNDKYLLKAKMHLELDLKVKQREARGGHQNAALAPRSEKTVISSYAILQDKINEEFQGFVTYLRTQQSPLLKGDKIVDVNFSAPYPNRADNKKYRDIQISNPEVDALFKQYIEGKQKKLNANTQNEQFKDFKAKLQAHIDTNTEATHGQDDEAGQTRPKSGAS